MAMLGAECNACCSRCGCVHGKLPYTMTVTLAGLKNKTHGNYCDLSISSCYGGGAAGVATAPGGCDGEEDSACAVIGSTGGKCNDTPTYGPSARGPLSGVLLTESGSGYAKIGRVAPTLQATATPGSGAAFTVSTTKHQDACGVHYWQVSSISVTGGTGYTNGGVVAISALAGDTTESPASATVHTKRYQPTLTASIAGGTGAAFDIVYSKSGSAPFTWEVSGITVTAGGTGYENGEPVAFALGVGDKQDVAAAAAAVVVVAEGVVQSVSVSQPGKYYKDYGEPDGVAVTAAGKYYREDEQATPYTSKITITPCGGGSGAKISATVDTSLTGGRFGEVIGLTIDDGGSDYLAWHWVKTCNAQLNGVPFVLKADTPEQLVSLAFQSAYGSGASASVTPLGNRTQPEVCLVGSGQNGSISPTLKSDVENENQWLKYWSFSSVSATGGYGYTNDEKATIDYRGATVAEGGEVTLQATGVTEEDPPNAKNDGVLTGATVVKAGKFYVQHAYDGAAGPIKLVQLDNGGTGYAKYGRQQPNLLFTGSGTGATFVPTFKQQQDEYSMAYWEIESVSASGGLGYVNGESLSISLATSSDKSKSQGEVRVFTREPPEVSAQAQSDSGSGASFSVTLSPSVGLPRTWSVSGISVASGGTGYGPSTPVQFAVATGGTKVEDALATATTNNLGVITSVELLSGGAYYLDNGKAIETATLAGGHYYCESKSLAPYVASVTVTVNQTLPSAGSGAQITATVDSDTYSNKFGQIKKLTVVNGGSGYQILGGPLDCTYSGPCGIQLDFRGKGKPAELTLGDAVFRTKEVLDDCNKLPTSASVLHSIGEGVVTIAPGGAWDDKVRCPCGSCCEQTKCAVPPPCPSCTGDCDACNKCASGCGCDGGNCVPCCGPCDEENQCPEGCECVDGQCVACPHERTCGKICCPEGATCVKYAGTTLAFFIGESCSGEGFNNDPEGQAAIARVWMDAIAEWMNANGYTKATGGAGAPTEPICTACVGPDSTCDLWGSVLFGVSACCEGVQEEDYGPEWLDVFGDVFPGQDPPFYWQDFSGIPHIPPCIPNELP